MSGYTKLFNSILASTVWSEPNEVRIVWITMLAMANKDGRVEGSVPGLAVFARLSVEDTRHALERLSSPDEDSRSKELDGRRISAIDGGWQLVNHFKYRQQMSADERREYLRIKKQEQRQRDKKASQPPVNSSRGLSAMYTHTAPAPYTAPDPEIDSNNKPDRKGAASIKAVNGSRAYRTDPIIGRNPHLDHAACDEGFSYCVPIAVHRKLADLLAPKHAGDREAAKDALQKWYPTIWAIIPDQMVMGDAFRFWQSHFDTAFASQPSAKPRKQTTAELTEAVRAAMIAAGEM